MAQAAASGMWATDPAPHIDDSAGVRVLHWLPEGPPRGRVIHFHGGGYRLGCPEMDGPFAAALARACGVEVIVPEYRLAPEWPFPAAANDALAVLWVTGAELPLVFSGASAGGGIAAALVQIARAEERRVAGLALHSPWLDLTVTAQSYDANGPSDPLFSREAATQAAQLYLQGLDPRDPLASPLHADPALFPPTLVSVGSGEVLRDDAEQFAARLGDRARLLVIEGMEHVAVTRDPASAGGQQTFAEVCDFVSGLVGQAARQSG